MTTWTLTIMRSAGRGGQRSHVTALTLPLYPYTPTSNLAIDSD